MMAYEPMVLLTAIGMYMVTKSFLCHEIASHPALLVLALPGVFLGFLYTLEIKFRKSPFDLSVVAPRPPGTGAGHDHRVLRARRLAMIEMAHWYETVFLLGWVYLFFAVLAAAGRVVSLLVFGFVILVDNVFARLKWQTALRSAWAVAAVLGFGNILVLSLACNRDRTMFGIKKSPWLIHYDASSCNGCDIETLACLTPDFRCRAPGRHQYRQPQARRHLPGHRRGQRAEQGGHPQHLPPVARAQSGGGRRRLRLQRRHFPRVLQHSGRRGQRHAGGCLCPGLRRAARSHHRRRGQGAGRDGGEAGQSDAPSRRPGQSGVCARGEGGRAVRSMPCARWPAQRDAVLSQQMTPSQPATNRGGTGAGIHENRIFLKAVINGKIIGAVSGALGGPTVRMYGPAIHPYFENTEVRRAIAERRSRRPFRRRNISRPRSARRMRSFSGTCPIRLSKLQDRGVHAEDHLGSFAKGA